MNELLRLATAGGVDDGKSTLIGRLLHDTKSIFEDQLHAVEEVSRRRGDPNVDLALLTDGLRAEREQGITIDVAHRYFSTPKRSFILADTPGHAQYTRNMVTGASTANVALILVDARRGISEQSRRHAVLVSLLRVPHLVLCVNKMDLVGYDQAAYDAIHDEFRDFVGKLDVGDLTSIPMSALHGDNVVARSAAMPWYEGPPLLHHLEHVHIASDRNLVDARFPVQLVIRDQRAGEEGYRAYAGQVASGVLRLGDEVLVLPSGATTSLAAIESPGGSVSAAFAPMSVALRLADDVDVSRGDLICRPHNRPSTTHAVDAMVCWMDATRPLTAGRRLLLQHTTRVVRAEVVELTYRLDVNSLHRDPAATALMLNDIGRVVVRTAAPLFADEYRRCRSTGSFVLVDEVSGATVAAGVISAALAAPSGLDRDVVWHQSSVARDERATVGATVWLTGLSASGKSTVASELERRLIAEGRPCYVLDGDNLRHSLNADLGFDRPSREENVRRVGAVAQLFADAGLIAIVPVIAPYAAGRDAVRAVHRVLALPFVEVHVATPLEVCEARDPKGLYRRARAGELFGMTGIDDPYEAPSTPELRLDGRESVTDAVAMTMEALGHALDRG